MKRNVLPLLLSILLLTGCSNGSDLNTPPVVSEAEICQTEVTTFPLERETENTVSEEVTATEGQPVEILREPMDTDFVLLSNYIPDILVELKYASEDNFTGRKIYCFSDVYLRYGTVKKLVQVQNCLTPMGLRLKIWDGFRPASAQFVLWDVCPNPVYVADPNVGFSSHSRGNTVDVTLTDAQGRELAMPTGFDNFTGLADRNYSDCAETEAANSQLLQEIMEKNGFIGYFGEWWHFSDKTDYPVEQCFDPAVISIWTADCRESLSLYPEPTVSCETTVSIPAGEAVTVLGFCGDFAMAEYAGVQGYALSTFLTPAVNGTEEVPETGVHSFRYHAVCENYISLRTQADFSAEVITRIPAGGILFLIEWGEPFALVDYNGLTGYVATNYIEPA